jgi:acyl-coenzyme A thioesterase PaaI-like protein
VTVSTLSQGIAQHLDSGNWKKIEDFFNHSEFAKHLGINVVLDDPTQPKCEVNEIKRFHLGGLGQSYINGVIISGLFDLVIGLTAIEYAPLGNFATTNVNIRFIKPVENNAFYAVAKTSRKVGNRVFSEATLFNVKNEPCAYATGEIRVGIN